MKDINNTEKGIYSKQHSRFGTKKNIIKSSSVVLLSMFYLLFISNCIFGQKMKLNEKEYFEIQGANILVFSNQYNGMFFDEKTAGIELIHHGVRTATGGAVRLQNTPEQWDLVPELVDKKIDLKNNSIEVTLRYEAYDFNSRVLVKGKDKGVEISVFLDQPLPEKLKGNAGFNMEFLPASYFEKSFLVDGKPGYFPLYPAGNTYIESGSKKIPQFAGHSTFDDRGREEFIMPEPIAVGKTAVLAPEDPERNVKIQSQDANLMLFDGRNLAQNGWFILRSVLPPQKTGKVLTWYVEPNAIPGWKREPVIEFSQVGYHPGQKKIAVIELDKNDRPLNIASVYQVTQDGKKVKKFTADVQQWGKYLRYNYLTFDFSSVNIPGLYFIQYGDYATNTFSINENVYENVWHSTMDVWFPVQMDHMTVNEAYRKWHGVPFLDDALQAPVNIQFFDGYSMDSVTDTKYKPYERIPGLAVGGWFDAGDFDIQTGSHCATILNFVNSWEYFGIDRDETFVDQDTRYVDIHRPDGKPDLLQQIEHGTLNLVAQLENIGHPVRGIVVPNLHQYHHLGDASTETDNLPYNPDLKPYESDGLTSGTMDDRWAFTNREPMLDYSTSAALAAAGRALENYNKELAEKSLFLAQQLYNETSKITKKSGITNRSTWGRFSEVNAVLQLFISTNQTKYADRFDKLIWPALDNSVEWTMSIALQAYPHMGQNYQNKLKDYVIKYKDAIDENNAENPYGVPMMTRGWGGNLRIINWAVTNYLAHRVFPEIIDRECIFRGLNYLYGCHPHSNISFVSSVGTRSKKVTYGNNRADFTFIAGGVVPGLLLLKPDFPENKENWPFLWGENECTIGGCSAYVFLANAANELLNENE
jgi:endoglucanase